ncbi:MAG TPA: 30S ribosome-binding factor RbfA [Chromatiales bacterium]|nr:30S ribosome-binding factor RbfA [Chromatiales bacterium]HEX21841.1 30S ribosome-binding factor RbfA [Chromatiales bacterium]
MAKEYSLGQRVGDEIQRQLAELIQTEIRDPRVGMVTITAVEVSHEFEHAKVHFTVLGDEAQADVTAKVLNKAAGFLRSALARRLKLRTTPALHFQRDLSMERGNRLTALINEAVRGQKSSDDD